MKLFLEIAAAVTVVFVAAAGADPTLARVLTICNGIAQKVGAPIGC